MAEGKPFFDADDVNTDNIFKCFYSMGNDRIFIQKPLNKLDIWLDIWLKQFMWEAIFNLSPISVKQTQTNFYLIEIFSIEYFYTCYTVDNTFYLMQQTPFNRNNKSMFS